MITHKLQEFEDRFRRILGTLPYSSARDLRIVIDELIEEVTSVPEAQETPFALLRKLDEIKSEVLTHQQRITIYPNDLDIVIVPEVVDGAYVVSLYHKADSRVQALVQDSLARMLPSPIFTEGTSQVNINLGVKR